jgi:hypothetical protein
MNETYRRPRSTSRHRPSNTSRGVRLVRTVRLARIGRQERVQPAHTLIIIDPVDPLQNLARGLELLREAPLHHEHPTEPAPEGPRNPIPSGYGSDEKDGPGKRHVAGSQPGPHGLFDGGPDTINGLGVGTLEHPLYRAHAPHRVSEL